MKKKFLKEIEEKLKKTKSAIEADLNKFAKEDKKLKGDWDTNFHPTDGGAGSQMLEDAADQVEEYMNLLPVEHNLELRLQAINNALEKLKKKTYGRCEICKKEIDEKRLKIYPEARLCGACEKKKK